MGDSGDFLSIPVQSANELKQKLSETRHQINNHLTMLSTGLELVRRDPEKARRISESLMEQPGKIRDLVADYSCLLEETLEINGLPPAERA